MRLVTVSSLTVIDCGAQGLMGQNRDHFGPAGPGLDKGANVELLRDRGWLGPALSVSTLIPAITGRGADSQAAR